MNTISSWSLTLFPTLASLSDGLYAVSQINLFIPTSFDQCFTTTIESKLRDTGKIAINYNLQLGLPVFRRQRRVTISAALVNPAAGSNSYSYIIETRSRYSVM